MKTPNDDHLKPTEPPVGEPAHCWPGVSLHWGHLYFPEMFPWDEERQRMLLIHTECCNCQNEVWLGLKMSWSDDLLCDHLIPWSDERDQPTQHVMSSAPGISQCGIRMRLSHFSRGLLSKERPATNEVATICAPKSEILCKYCLIHKVITGLFLGQLWKKLQIQPKSWQEVL